MNSTSKTENLFNDRVRKLSDNMASGVAASLAGAGVLALVVRKVVDSRQLGLWIAGMVLITFARMCLRKYYEKIEKNGPGVRRYRILLLASLAMTGMVWGSTAFWSFPSDQLGYQVFITFILGGMVAGSVGIYSAMVSAFFVFSVPTLFPMILKFYLVGQQSNYAMGSMLFLFWIIMLWTALKLNRDIIGYLAMKYENLELIAVLEAEMKVREAAEQDLTKKNLEIEGIVARRTEDLLESNKKLIREIEERRQIAVALKENEEKYRDLVESINDVIYSADETGMVTYVSPVVTAVLGYAPEELVGKNFKDYVHRDDLPMFSGVLQKRLAGNTDIIEYRFLTKGNEYRWVRSSSRAVFKEDSVVGIRGNLTDISGKRKLEEQLRRTHKMEAITTLSGGVAHEFNNLLAVILGNSELAMMDTPDDHPVRNFLRRIVEASEKATTIVKELLSFARQSQTKRRPINIGEMVLEDVGRLKPILPASITLETDITGDVEMMFGDPPQIRQVMENLMDNAVEAMSNTGGVLVIEVNNVLLSAEGMDFDSELAPGKYIRITVKDTGIGIGADDVSRVFDPYYTTKEVANGDGLGLAVVHGIVKRHGGGIRVTSELGRGTCFDIFFPAGEMMPVSGPTPPES